MIGRRVKIVGCTPLHKCDSCNDTNVCRIPNNNIVKIVGVDRVLFDIKLDGGGQVLGIHKRNVLVLDNGRIERMCNV